MTEFSVEQLQRHAAQIRASGILGRSELMLRLFDFLVDCAASNRVPKEIEIAMTVFGKPATFDVAQDAVVRVYIFKLRRRLNEHYQRDNGSAGPRLHLLKGEYRLVFEGEQEPIPPQKLAEPSDQAQTQAQPELAQMRPESSAVIAVPDLQLKRWKQRVWVLSGCLLIVIVAAISVVMRQSSTGSMSANLVSARQQAVWADMLDDNLPIFVVLGDYYIFGELSDDTQSVRRLVRDFDINSVHGLEQYLKVHPEQAGRYTDLSLKYLPVSVAFALRDVLPLLESGEHQQQRVQVALASDVTLSMVRSAHVVYIGLISGMGVLQQFVFDGSQVRIGDSFDELVDLTTGKRYVSEESTAGGSRQAYRDYGYFASRTGTDGNQIIVLAGTRDVALQYVAEMVTQSASLEILSGLAGASQNMEGLYTVQALDGSSMGGKPVMAHQFSKPRAGMMDVQSSSATSSARPSIGSSAKTSASTLVRP